MPDDQRCFIGPLEVVQHDDRRCGRAQLVYQRFQHFDTAGRRIACRVQPLLEAAEQGRGVRSSRVRRTRPYLEAVKHHAQRQPLGQRARDPPPDVPVWVAAHRQGLSYQGGLADTRLAFDPDHRPLTTAEGLDTSTQDRELLLTAYPLLRPVNRPHRPPRTRCAPMSSVHTIVLLLDSRLLSRRHQVLMISASPRSRGVRGRREQAEGAASVSPPSPPASTSARAPSVTTCRRSTPTSACTAR